MNQHQIFLDIKCKRNIQNKYHYQQWNIKLFSVEFWEMKRMRSVAIVGFILPTAVLTIQMR